MVLVHEASFNTNYRSDIFFNITIFAVVTVDVWLLDGFAVSQIYFFGEFDTKKIIKAMRGLERQEFLSVEIFLCFEYRFYYTKNFESDIQRDFGEY